MVRRGSSPSPRAALLSTGAAGAGGSAPASAGASGSLAEGAEDDGAAVAGSPDATKTSVAEGGAAGFSAAAEETSGGAAPGAGKSASLDGGAAGLALGPPLESCGCGIGSASALGAVALAGEPSVDSALECAFSAASVFSFSGLGEPGSLSLGLAEPFGLAGFGAGFLAAMAAQLLIAGGSSSLRKARS